MTHVSNIAIQMHLDVHGSIPMNEGCVKYAYGCTWVDADDCFSGNIHGDSAKILLIVFGCRIAVAPCAICGRSLSVCSNAIL